MAIRSSFPSDRKPGRLVIAGDWHGDVDQGLAVIAWAVRHGAEGILQLGDFGIWAGSAGRNYLKQLTFILARADLRLAFIDGNHENFDVLERYRIDHGVRPLTSRITHLPRGYRWTWGKRTWLALGGGVSLDRGHRREHISWWRQEEITAGQAELVFERGAADYMLTHDAPATIDVPGLHSNWPQDALLAASRHRELLALIVDVVRPSCLFHGHMHVRYAGTLQHAGGTCVVNGLASNIEPFIDNVMLVDLDADGNLVLPRS